MTRLDRTNALHHVYRCFDAEGRLAYVGSSANLFGRLSQHMASSWWAPTVAKVKAEVYPNGVVARDAERRAIREEVPRWNKAGKWAGRHLWTRTDWLDWITVLLHGTGGAPRYMPSNVRTAVSTYESLFAEPLPEPFASRIRAIETASAERRAREDEEARVRREQMDREDELSLARERKQRADLGIPEECICTLEEIFSGKRSPLFTDDCEIHHPEAGASS